MAIKVAMSTGSGHISSKILPRLLEAGAEIRVLARHPDKLKNLAERGVKVIEGSLDNADSVRELTRDADVLFWMSPPNPAAEDVLAHQQKLAHNAVEAIRANRVPRVVNLSSIGAEERTGLGLVSGLGKVEDILDTSGADITHFRPAFFMENFEMQIPGILGDGKVYMAFDGEQPVPQIASADIAEAMSRRILDDSWKGTHVQELHGFEDLSFARATEVIGEELGRKLEYVQVSPQQLQESIRGMGASESMAANYAELMEGMAAGRSKRLNARTEDSTTPTEFRHYVQQEMLPAMRGMQAQGQPG